MPVPVLVTVCEQRRMAHAAVLARSFAEHHPGARAVVVVADAAAPIAADDDDDVDWLTGADLEPERFELLAAALDAPALARELVPVALAQAGATALALAPDGELLAPLDLSEATLATIAAGHEPAAAVAPWNAVERGLAVRDGQLATAAGAPVGWIRFPPRDPTKPDGAVRDIAGAGDAFIAALAAYRKRVSAATAGLPAATASFATMLDGTPLDDRLRRLFARAVREGQLRQAPFHAAGMLAFARWLDEPEQDPRAGGVSRHLFAVWLDRPDLQAAYPDLRRQGDRHGFLDWSVMQGKRERAVPDWLAPEDRLVGEANGVPAPDVGANLVGCWDAASGQGEAARGLVGALDAAEVALLVLDGGDAGQKTCDGGPARAADPQQALFAFNLVCLGAETLARFAERAGPRFFAGRRTIGAWWELPESLAGLRAAWPHVDEVWVGSAWLRDALEPEAPVPFAEMPVPVTRPRARELTRAQLGLPEGFLVLSRVDFACAPRRANPCGLVEAFARAFAPGDGASLVIETAHDRQHPRDRLRLELAAHEHPHVQLVQRPGSAAQRVAMLASCDLYASLHRSLGFGLDLAQAMALGRPALATGWSGNLEFMRPETAWLVPFELVAAPEGDIPGQWADPDLDSAGEAMRAVRAAPEEAARMAVAGAERLLADHDPARVGALMRARLEALAPWVGDRGAEPHAPGPASPSATAAITAARELADSGPRGPAPPRRDALRRRLHSSLVHATRPMTENQRAIDTALLDATSEVCDETIRLHARIDAEVTAGAELSLAALTGRRRIDLLERQLETLGHQIEELSATCAGLAGAQAALDESLRPLVRGAEAIPWTQGEPFSTFEHPVGGRVRGYRGHDVTAVTTAYRSFEDVFRGSRDRVRSLLERYADLLRGHDPVLDVGAGRGELLELLRDAGIAARGVDIDAGMAAGAAEQGLDVVIGDGVEHLESLEPGSLGAVTAIHVIEHLPQPQLERCFAAARRALRPGGLLVCETVNPHAAFALKTFWVDPTHQHPLFPETALVLARAAGFPTAFFTHLRGTRDVERDRFNEDSYTLVAEAPGSGPV